MVVDQVGLGGSTAQQSERFVVPGPPHQGKVAARGASSDTNSRVVGQTKTPRVRDRNAELAESDTFAA
ncbi:unnamed protein product [Strongylus vulgaris]|uniref:Uncharacterized protein n=1 Tax=Strongylus vulgaris TaxID=40348 RepID=A0A3P7IRU3_STRVU|nr:unnamed protein product [Strongylus vulgaris]